MKTKTVRASIKMTAGIAKFAFSVVAMLLPANTVLAEKGKTDVSGDCQLEGDYIREQLGEGFGKIISKGRFVPSMADGQMIGFKIFAIRENSLWERVGLQDGDVLTQVNDMKLSQPDQGFALFYAFEEEQEVRIELLRGGKAPKRIVCSRIEQSKSVAKAEGAKQSSPSSKDTGECQLEKKYVADQLGDGFGKIISMARLVPRATDGQMDGFKIFSIVADSLWTRVGLKNGDVITQVNGTRLKRPEQGFALYEVFRDESDVRIELLRGNKMPMNIVCQIK